MAPVRSVNAPGFFEAEALLGYAKASTRGAAGNITVAEPKTLVILFDTSLSMQWEKLERSYQTLEALLRTLRPSDHFNLLLFNNQVQPFQPSPVAADPLSIRHALDFVRSSKLRGGTDLQRVLQAALQQCSASGISGAYLVLFSDGGATRGPIQNGTLANWYVENWQRLPEIQRPRTYVFGVGDDANLPLLTMLARQDGLLEHALSTEPADFKLNSFISKIGRSPVGQLGLAVAPEAVLTRFIRYSSLRSQARLPPGLAVISCEEKMSHSRFMDCETVLRSNCRPGRICPLTTVGHPQLPRLWARARVDALLEKIQREGEDQATIDEITRLSRQYKFVTPYTSFLAVPRALLRPRVIRPGDPVLRLKTDESIRSVTALFPFGLVQKLRYLSGEDVWQTRFLAPDDMQDGTYTVRLVLRDNAGHTYREFKTFVIASKPPVVQIKLETRRYHRGQTMRSEASASQSTRTLIARLEGASPVALNWDARAGSTPGSCSSQSRPCPEPTS